MIFKDRCDAGKQLAKKLASYKNNKDTIIIGLPRGGVVVANQVAKELNLSLDIIVPRKIGFPGNPETAIGAITVDGQLIFDWKIISKMAISQDYIDYEIEKEKKEAVRRLRTYRGSKPALDFKGKIVILIDDGIATGATARVAIKSARARGAEKIIVAIPVVSRGILNVIKKESYTDKETEYIKRKLYGILGDDMHLIIRFVDYIPPTKSGKFRLLIQKLPIEFGDRSE